MSAAQTAFDSQVDARDDSNGALDAPDAD
jgi:hypothetical protein